MEIFIWWCLLLDQAQEALPVFMCAVRPTCPDYSAVKNRQCGKQCCDAISSFFCVARTSCRRAARALFPYFRDGNQWQLGFLQAAGSFAYFGANASCPITCTSPIKTARPHDFDTVLGFVFPDPGLVSSEARRYVGELVILAAL
jgi:hypothetical protein